jgi:hypothetical protein
VFFAIKNCGREPGRKDAHLYLYQRANQMFAHLSCGAKRSFFAGGRLKTIIMALGERKVCWITKTAPWSGIDLSYNNFGRLLYSELSLMVRSLTLLPAKVLQSLQLISPPIRKRAVDGTLSRPERDSSENRLSTACK